MSSWLTHAIAKCSPTGLVQLAKKSCWKWGLKSHMWISHYTASSFRCHPCGLEFKMLLPPAKKQKTPACIREIQVHKFWTKVYSQQGLTAMWWKHPQSAICWRDTEWLTIKSSNGSGHSTLSETYRRGNRNNTTRETYETDFWNEGGKSNQQRSIMRLESASSWPQLFLSYISFKIWLLRYKRCNTNDCEWAAYT